MHRHPRKRSVRLTCLALLCLLGLGCSSEDARDDAGAPAAPDETTTPTPEQLAQLTYYDILDEPVELVDGRFVGEPFVEGGASRPVVELLDEMMATGDLNGDGIDEAAVLLAESSGGSGMWVHVAAVGAPLGQPSNYGSARVGDRPQVRAMGIDGQRIWLDLVDKRPGDPACCPSGLWMKEWGLVEGRLIMVSAVLSGKLSTSELAGRDWVLTHLQVGEVAPGDPAITIRFERDRALGSSGCNRYFAGVHETSPGALQLEGIGGTSRACPSEVMDLEARFLDRLSAVTGYRYWMGRLALEWQLGGASGMLLFDARRPDAPATVAPEPT